LGTVASSAARSPTRRPAAGPTSGVLLAKRRIGDDAAGFTALLHLPADAGDSPEPPIPVAIETGRARVGFQNHGHGI
jgi:hypothetical protein